MQPVYYERRAALEFRVLVFRAVSAGVCVVLLLAFWGIQGAGDSRYRERAEDNSTESHPIPAARGAVHDRDRNLIAGSSTRISAQVEGGEVTPDLLGKVAERLRLDPGHIERLLDQAPSLAPYEHLVVKQDLQSSDLAFLSANREEFPQVKLVEEFRRHYGHERVAVHAVGYVGRASRQDLARREFLTVDYGAEIGKSGIERQYNHWLAGKAGRRRTEVDTHGRAVKKLEEKPPERGRDLALTIDGQLQAVAELGLRGRKGAAVAIDPNTGEILVMASAPSFDPNGFANGMVPEDWARLTSDPSTPLLNRAIQGTWAMGSVFKPIVGLAGLEANIAGPSFTATCKGGMAIGGRYFRCHKRDGHGTVALSRAIAASCDVYFYTLGLRLGIETLSKYAEAAGLGRKTGVDLPGEASGLVPSAEWKARRSLQPWFPGETAVVSIGQGAMAVTPLQAVHAIGGLALGGIWHRPRLVSDSFRRKMDENWRAPQPAIARIDREHLRTLRDSMFNVVNGGGTGGQARLAGVDVCGKTGTSQRVSNSLRIRSGRPDFEDDAWFVGFAPCDFPKIVAGVLIENGKSSSLAAAVVRDILQAWHLGRPPDDDPKPKRRETPTLAMAGPGL